MNFNIFTHLLFQASRKKNISEVSKKKEYETRYFLLNEHLDDIGNIVVDAHPHINEIYTRPEEDDFKNTISDVSYSEKDKMFDSTKPSYSNSHISNFDPVESSTSWSESKPLPEGVKIKHTVSGEDNANNVKNSFTLQPEDNSFHSFKTSSNNEIKFPKLTKPSRSTPTRTRTPVTQLPSNERISGQNEKTNIRYKSSPQPSFNPGKKTK